MNTMSYVSPKYQKRTNPMHLIAGFCRENDKLSFIPSSVLELIKYYFPSMNGHNFIWNISSKNLEFLESSSSDTAIIDSDVFDIGLPNNFFLSLKKDNKINNCNLILSLMCFPLSQHDLVQVIHCELYLMQIGAEYSKILDLTRRKQQKRSGSNDDMYIHHEWLIIYDLHNNGLNELTFECKINVLRNLGRNLNRNYSYVATPSLTLTNNTMKFIWNFCHKTSIDTLMKYDDNEADIQFHSGVFYDMFQLQIGRTSEEGYYYFQIQLCGLCANTAKMGVHLQLFAMNTKNSNKSNKIQIISNIVTFSYENPVYKLADESLQLLINILEQSKTISISCVAQIIHKYDENGDMVQKQTAVVTNTESFVLDHEKKDENEVSKWLKDVIELPEYIELFKQHQIDDIEFVKSLAFPTLQSMGIKTIGHQIKFVHYIQRLLSCDMLQYLPNSEKKRLISDQLFPKIQSIIPGLADKITPILMEMDNNELMVLLYDQKELLNRIGQALSVLKNNTHISSVLCEPKWIQCNTNSFVWRMKDTLLNKIKTLPKAVSVCSDPFELIGKKWFICIWNPGPTQINPLTSMELLRFAVKGLNSKSIDCKMSIKLLETDDENEFYIRGDSINQVGVVLIKYLTVSTAKIKLLHQLSLEIKMSVMEDHNVEDRNNSKENEVKIWLRDVVGLPQYYYLFMEQGIDTLRSVKLLEIKYGTENWTIGIKYGHFLIMADEIKKLKGKDKCSLLDVIKKYWMIGVVVSISFVVAILLKIA